MLHHFTETLFRCVFEVFMVIHTFQLLSILSEGGIVPEDIVMQLILARLDAPDIEHYGK